MKRLTLTIVVLLALNQMSIGQKGKDGALEVAGKNRVLNEFTTLTRNVKQGVKSISVQNASLNQNGRFDSSLSAGDLLMIIQMQGAIINGDRFSAEWGSVLDYGDCGNWEFQEVEAVSSKRITLTRPLKHSYTATGKVQVVRIPRLTKLTVKSNSVLTTIGWNGRFGGVLSVEVDGNVIIEGGAEINATGLGFRGGTMNTAASLNHTMLFGTEMYTSFNPFEGAEKGEGIAGFLKEYDRDYGGMYCRGAPANGGGGGNSHNSAGGGGANAGIISNWTGNGNPDIEEQEWIAAWNLESPDFAFSSSSGGGRGGYSYSASNKNASEAGPGHKSWSGDLRRNVGGLGGRPLDYSSGKLFLGGGGGAGDSNNDNGTAGANGGGLIYLLCEGNIVGRSDGNSLIVANGADAETTSVNRSLLGGRSGDGPGGGGGGGTIVLDTKEDISSVSVMANGGKGGSQMVIMLNESEGPGGGGGGGYIAANSTLETVVLEVFGGDNGITNSKGVKEFIPNGATYGGQGTIQQVSNYEFDKQIQIKGADNLTFANKKPTSFDLVKPGEIVKLKTVFFNRASPKIEKSGYDELSILSDFLKNNPDYKIEIIGYSSDSDKSEQNIRLSKNRASAVTKFLINKGISKDRISSTGYGTENALATRESDKKLKQQTRIDFRIY